MADTATAAQAEAQPQADANDKSINIDQIQAPKEILEDDTADSADKPEEAFPKKAVNAISRRDKQIGKLRAQYEQTQAELRTLREQSATRQPQSAKSDGPPKEANFTNYAEYLEAVNDYKIEKRFTELNKKQQDDNQSIQEQAWVAQREKVVDQQGETFAKEHPDMAALIEENADIIAEYPPALKRAFLDADNTPLALANLAKEGKLEALATMPLHKAIMEIGRAQTQAPSRPVTKAPTPMTPAKGSASGSKDPSQMTDVEFNRWRRDSIKKNRNY